MEVKSKLEEIFYNTRDKFEEVELPKKGLKILINYDNNHILISIFNKNIEIKENMEDVKADNVISTDANSLNDLLNGSRSLIDLIIDGKIVIKGKLTYLLKIADILEKSGIRSGLNESNLCKILKAVFEGICNTNEEILKSIRNYEGTFQMGILNGETCCLKISNGNFSVISNSCGDKPLASIYASRDTWNELIKGEENVGSIALNGKAKIEGNLLQAFKLKTIIDKIL